MKKNKKPLSISVDDIVFVTKYLKKNKKPNSKTRRLLKRGRNLLKKGSEEAANLFGILYADGLLFKQDLKKSVELFLMGEKTNNPKMICNAGRSYMNMSFDDTLSQKEQEFLFDKALEYVTRAANMNHIPAIKFLASIHADWFCYAPEALLEHNLLKSKRLIAKELHEKAIALGHKESTQRIAEMYFYSELEDDENGSNTRLWLFRAAEENIPSAFQMLGELYASKGNYIVEHDESKAFTWTLKAAEAGNDIAMLDLIEMYRDGIGVEKNSEKSLYWKNKFEATPQ
jgi:hypothetical protein